MILMSSNRNISRLVATLTHIGLAALGAAPVHAGPACPSRPVKIIVPVPPGPTLDLLPRIIAQKLSTRWGQSVLVENRPGAAQNLGAEIVAKAEPDGCTLLAAPPGPLVVSQSFFKQLRFDPTAFAPVSLFATQPLLLAVNGHVPATSLQELIAYAKANPDKLTYGSAGTGSTLHLTMELLKLEAGVRMTHVPYPGLGPLLTDLIAGRIDVAFVSAGNVLQHYQGRDLRILAVATPTRIPELADVPAISESFPGVVSISWFALVAPPNTPSPITHAVSGAIAETLHQSDVVQRFRALFITPLGTTPEETAKVLHEDAARWHDVIARAGVTME